jgi:hypothetical protein
MKNHSTTGGRSDGRNALSVASAINGPLPDIPRFSVGGRSRLIGATQIFSGGTQYPWTWESPTAAVSTFPRMVRSGAARSQSRAILRR